MSDRDRRIARTALWVLLALVALALPLYADVPGNPLYSPVYLPEYLLQPALFAFAYIVAALGLTLLTGQAGQMSLGHAFFVGIGAYGYTVLAAPPADGHGGASLVGLGLPPLLAALLAVLLAGLAGLLFTPISARLRGIYLGIATLGLVFGGQHLLNVLPALSGGPNGRRVPTFTLGGFQFETRPLIGDGPGRGDPDYLFGVPLTREQKLWYLGLVVTVIAYLTCRNMIASRPGRALRAVQHRELMAGMMGVPVTRYKGYAFMISSMYAGLGGVLFALAFGSIAPDRFDFDLSVTFLLMVVLGGIGSPAGAVFGAVFVAFLRALVADFAELLPGIDSTGHPGLVNPGTAATVAYGAAVVVLLLLEPGGAAALGRRLLGVLPAGRLRRVRA